MTVYGEFLFMENAVSGAVILLLTGRLCGYKDARPVRMTAGSIMCGGYSFVIFADLSWVIALMSKLIFSVVVTAAVFGRMNTKKFGKTVAVFYIVSFLMGGITIALMYASDSPGMTTNGSIYFYGVRYLQIMAGVLVTAVTGLWLSDHLQEKLRREAVMTGVTIHLLGWSWQLKAFVDTGNFLKEPVSGTPAVLVSASAGRRILRDIGDESDKRCCVIPYRSVGKKGILYGLRPDYISMGEHVIKDVVLAFNEEDFEPWKGYDEYDVLLQQQLAEGRI